MRQYKYLLLDLDNTVLDFDRAEEAAFTAASSASGILVDADMYACYHKINDALWKQLERGEVERERLKVLRYEQLLHARGIPDEGGLSETISRTYFTMLGQQRFLVPGAVEVCRTLSAHFPLYAVTNGSYEVQMGRFYGSGLEAYFTDLFISEKLGAAKPSPQFTEAVLASIGDMDASHYVMIGDSLTSDIAGAEAMSIDAVWLDRTNTGDTQGHSPMHIINDIRQLPELFLGRKAAL